MSLTVGIIGLGIMGSAFARNLADAGFTLCGFDIDESRLQALQKIGGVACSSPADVAERSDVVLVSLASIAAFHAVMTGDDGIAAAAKRDLIVIETSTLPIEDKILARDALLSIGVCLLDCPISGTGAQAVSKDLSVYTSGCNIACEKCNAVFEGFARQTFFVGEFGNGSKMKFVANLLVHIHNVASAEAMVLGMKSGLEPKVIYDVIKAGAGNSRIFELRAPMMIADDYTDATMKMDVWEKDMAIISEFAANLRCPVPMFNSGIDIYRSALAMGQDKLDTASVCRVLEQMANLERKNLTPLN